jgi:hypothetical protein
MLTKIEKLINKILINIYYYFSSLFFFKKIKKACFFRCKTCSNSLNCLTCKNNSEINS